MSEDPLDAEPLVSNDHLSLEDEAETTVEDPAPPVKRKGGRKPVYATLEERKQRNRQAQAAFRERRTEYIKQLESNMKDNEESLQQLQQSNREVTEECHMLRYKTSLLEEILYENGIDFQSELQAKSSKSLLASPYPPQGSMRSSWPQHPPSDMNRERRPRPLKLRERRKSSNSQQLILQQDSTSHSSPHARPSHHGQPAYLFPNSPRHQMGSLSLNNEPTSPDPIEFDLANGALHPIQSQIHSHPHRFDEPPLDPSISHGERPEPFYTTHANHMTNYLGPERFADVPSFCEPTNSNRRPLESVPELERGDYQNSPHLRRRPRAESNSTARMQLHRAIQPMMHRHKSFSKSYDVGLEDVIGISPSDLSVEVSLEEGLMN